MRPSERFALRWDGFKANAIDALSNMRGEREFLDVTLVADNGEQVGANKVVLAGGSAFFNKILKENPHPHPLIYMKGVGFAHLGYIMDFIYTGEARIFQDDLNQFMDMAQDLKVKGLTLTTPSPRQGEPAAKETGPLLGMLRPSRRDVTSTCPEQAAPPSTISNRHNVKSAQDQSHVFSAHRKHEDQVAPKISAPNKGQLATEECASAPGITAPHEGRLATEDHASSNPDIVASSQSYNSFPKSTSMEDRGGTCNVKVEVADADLFNVYYETNENGEAYISDVSKRVDVDALDEGQVATEENRDIFHMEDRGDVGDAANVDVYYGNNNHGEECMRDVSKRVTAKVHGTGLCMEQEKNYQSMSAGKKVLVREENNSVSDAHVKQANDCYQLETKPSKKCSINIKKVNISKYTEVSSKSRISSKNYDHEKNPDKKVGSMRSFDRKYMVDDMINIKVKDMSSMNEHATHDLGQENTTHGKLNPFTKMFGMPSQIKRRETSQTGENMYWYQCEVCHKKFGHLGNFKLHYRIHTGEKPFQCEVCFKKFSQYGNLKVHKRIHIGEKPFQCEVCLKKFSTSSDLYRHKRIHTAEKPYQCSVCLKKFSQSGSLKKHERIHTGEMPYQCDVCLKKFRHVATFNRHKIVHTDEKLY